MGQQTVGIIPARGGSKRVPRKNVREIGGKPLIAHTIEQVRESDAVGETVVTTDDDEIADVAASYGATVVDRPAAFATDTAPVADAITHAYESLTGEYDTICMLQATSPLRATTDVDNALDRFEDSTATALVSTTRYTQEPQHALTEDDQGRLHERFEPATLFTDEYVRGQDLAELYFPNGAIFVVDVDRWLDTERLYTDDTIGYEMPPERSLQIDEPWEFEMIDLLLTHGFDA